MATTRRPGGTPKNHGRAASSRTGGSTSARGPATRPASASRGRRLSEERPTPRSIKNLAILASVFVILAIMLVPALRSTFSQQSQINGLRERIAQQQGTVAALQQELAFVVQQRIFSERQVKQVDARLGQRGVGQLDRRPVVRPGQVEPDRPTAVLRHRGEDVGGVAQRLAHLLAGEGHPGVVHPVGRERVAGST